MYFANNIKKMVKEFSNIYVGKSGDEELLPLGIIKHELSNLNWSDIDYFSAWNLIVDNIEIIKSVLEGDIPKQYDRELFIKLNEKYKKEIKHTLDMRCPLKDHVLLLSTNDEVEFAKIISDGVINNGRQYVLTIRLNRISEIYAENDPYPYDLFELDSEMESSRRTFREVVDECEIKETINLFEKTSGMNISALVGEDTIDVVEKINKRNTEFVQKIPYDERSKFGVRKPLTGNYKILTQQLIY